MSAPEQKLSKTENVNKPNWRRFVMQGRDRFLAKVHREVEQKTAGGILIPKRNQNIPSTGVIVALSPMSDEGKASYFVKVGDNIQTVPNSWTELEIDGELMATGILDYIVATYEFKNAEEELAKQSEEQLEKERQALERMKDESVKSSGETAPVPSRIRVK
jgi:co-chaperonin GroES (HSP10)